MDDLNRALPTFDFKSQSLSNFFLLIWLVVTLDKKQSKLEYILSRSFKVFYVSLIDNRMGSTRINREAFEGGSNGRGWQGRSLGVRRSLAFVRGRSLIWRVIVCATNTLISIFPVCAHSFLKRTVIRLEYFMKPLMISVWLSSARLNMHRENLINQKARMLWQKQGKKVCKTTGFQKR